MDLKSTDVACRVNEIGTVFKKLKLECPFTWQMDQITKVLLYDKDHTTDPYHSTDTQEPDFNDDEPVHISKLMKHIMEVYVNVKARSDIEVIKNEFEKCSAQMNGLKKYNHPQISQEVASFVLLCTQYFAFKELNLMEELERTFESLSEIETKNWQMNNKDTSTLNACRSICWSVCYRIPVFESENFIRKAIYDNPNCDVWHYKLGKFLRQKRRDTEFWSCPSEEEKDSFLKAYDISGYSHAYGVFIADMYRNLNEYEKAMEFYEMVFKKNPQKPTILLRLALGFIHLKSYTNAKVCLDKVEAVQPNRSMFLHYRGLYHMKLGEYEKAKIYLQKASSDNISAEKQYLYCAVKLDKTFDIIQYLHGMIQKYKDFSQGQMQQLLLDLALIYWNKKGDMQNAVTYFLKAVEINPNAVYINKFYICKFIWIKEKNMYRLLHEKILPFVFRNEKKFEQSCIDKAEELMKYCDKYFAEV